MTTLSINSSVVREVDELPQDVRPCFYGTKSSDSKKREWESKAVNEGMVITGIVYINLCLQERYRHG